MYEVNGINLSGSQYRELRALVELPDDESRASRARATMSDEDGVELYEALLDNDLIHGFKTWGGVMFRGVAQPGVDFVEDYEESQKEAKEAEARGNWHDYKVTLLGAISSSAVTFALGVLAEHYANVVSLIASLFS